MIIYWVEGPAQRSTVLGNPPTMKDHPFLYANGAGIDITNISRWLFMKKVWKNGQLSPSSGDDSLMEGDSRLGNSTMIHSTLYDLLKSTSVKLMSVWQNGSLSIHWDKINLKHWARQICGKNSNFIFLESVGWHHSHKLLVRSVIWTWKSCLAKCVPNMVLAVKDKFLVPTHETHRVLVQII